MKISVLDRSVLLAEKSGEEALAATLNNALYAEKYGYHRFWVSEHHNFPLFQSASPEILVAALTQVTKRIRLGAGGVMLTNHSPYRIAENFHLLEAIAGGRIDCGIGRASGGDAESRYLLNPGMKSDDLKGFERKFIELETFLYNRHSKIMAYPLIRQIPQLWMLSAGHTGLGTRLAAKFGTGLVVGAFINHRVEASLAGQYRKVFHSSSNFKKPEVIVALECICSDNPEELEFMVKLSDLIYLRRVSGERVDCLPTLKQLKEIKFSSLQQAYLKTVTSCRVTGTYLEASEKLIEKTKALGGDECMITPLLPDFVNREEFFQKIAEAMQQVNGKLLK